MRRRLALAFGGLGAGLVLAAALPVTAAAAASIRVGWWNSASSNGTAAPSPSTPSGGIRVAAGPGGTTPVPGASATQEEVLAYGAVLYQADEGSTGTLTLKIAGSAQGTPQIVACPTRTVEWTAGDDQPAPGPDYDCASQHFPGTVSADGTSVSFHVTAQFESTPGQLSLAIVPDLSSTALPTGPSPFGVDFNAPDQTSFASESSSSGSESSTFNPGSFAAPAGSVGGPLGLPAVNVAPPVAPPHPAAPATTAPKSPPAGTAPAAATSPLLVLRSRLATAIGAFCLLVAVLLWSSGFGLLGGRVIPLSVPLKPS